MSKFGRGAVVALSSIGLAAASLTAIAAPAQAANGCSTYKVTNSSGQLGVHFNCTGTAYKATLKCVDTALVTRYKQANLWVEIYCPYGKDRESWGIGPS